MNKYLVLCGLLGLLGGTLSHVLHLEGCPIAELMPGFEMNGGSLGTSGRPCNRTSPSNDGCALLCCGRGFNTKLETRRERCDCTFTYCCQVKCKTCVRTVEVYTCK